MECVPAAQVKMAVYSARLCAKNGGGAHCMQAVMIGVVCGLPARTNGVILVKQHRLGRGVKSQMAQASEALELVTV